MMMDITTIVQGVTENVNDRLRQNDLSTPPNFLYEWIVAAILENNNITPNNLEVDYTHAERFAEVLRQWLFDKDGNPLIIDSNQTSQILQQLGQDGWTIVSSQ